MEQRLTDSRRLVVGAPVDAVTLAEATAMVIDAASAPRSLAVSALAVHGVMLATDDAELRYRLNHFDLITPDGQPVRWALNWIHGTYLRDRVAGPDLMWDVCRQSADLGLPVFLYGSEERTLGLLVSNLEKAFPGLDVAGFQPSRFRRADEAEALEDAARIKESGARVVFVGLGCPRQEIWVYENREALGIPTLAVGAAFDYHAGLLRRAPSWMSRTGLEWLYRLLQEPRRLWKRYVLLNPRFLVGVLRQRLGSSLVDAIGTQPVEPVRPG